MWAEVVERGSSERRSSHPLTYAEAKAECPLPVPSTARNIQYYTWTQVTAWSDYLRFDAPVEDCIEYAEQLLSGTPAKTQTTRSAPTTRRSTILSPIPWVSSTAPASDEDDDSTNPTSMPDSAVAGRDGPAWFNSGAIRHGFKGRGKDPGLEIWIDADSGTLYYRNSN